MVDDLPPPALSVLVVCPPAQQAALAAALPLATFQASFAAPAASEDAAPPPAVILLSLDDAAALPQVALLVAGGPPVVVLLAAETELAVAVLAAGASDYVYRLDNWEALLPFHLYRAAQAGQAVLVLAARQKAMRQLAHDLRGPLSYLVGYSELLTMQDKLPAKVQEMAQEMLSEAEKLAVQIDRFASDPAC